MHDLLLVILLLIINFTINFSIITSENFVYFIFLIFQKKINIIIFLQLILHTVHHSVVYFYVPSDLQKQSS